MFEQYKYLYNQGLSVYLIADLLNKKPNTMIYRLFEKR